MERCGGSPADFSSDEVLDWLADDVGLSQFVPGFQEWDVNGADMNEASKVDLAELGVTSGMHQAKIIGRWKRKASNHDACLRAT